LLFCIFIFLFLTKKEEIQKIELYETKFFRRSLRIFHKTRIASFWLRIGWKLVYTPFLIIWIYIFVIELGILKYFGIDMPIWFKFIISVLGLFFSMILIFMILFTFCASLKISKRNKKYIKKW
jgi:hypothetical protein